MGYHAHDLRPSDLGPEDGFHVVAKPGDREPGEAVHTPRDPLNVALLSKLNETDLVQPSCPRLRGREVAGLVLGKFVQNGVPLAFLHCLVSMAII